MSKSGNRKSRSNEGFILYQNNVGKTVQTSWRPQLPLPKEVVPPTTSADPNTRSSEMNRHSNAANCSSNRKDTHQSAPQISAGGNKKGFFGRLFRKKKEAETESSSEEDRKAGFVVSPKYRKKDKKKRGSKLIGGGFDHIVVSPTRDNEFFLPFEPVAAAETHSATHLAAPVTYEPHSRSTNSLDRRSKRDRKKLEAQDAQLRHSSSEEEMVSLNSSTTFTKYRSDESLGSGGPGMNGNGQSRRSRAARNERYYKRLSRDGEVSHGQLPITYAPQPAQRWKTQPVQLTTYNEQISQNPINQRTRPQYLSMAAPDQKTRNSTNLSQGIMYAPISYGVQQPPRNLQNTVNDGKRSISYDSHIHLQNAKKPLPPPPPPRDPLRRVNVAGHSDHRPISYAFDQSSSQPPKPTGMSARCVSDDRIWGGNAPLYHSASSINYHPPSTASSQNRRFITRAERDAHPTKKSLPSGLDFRYVAEATPRSRKPIHLLNQEEPKSVQPPSPGIIRTTKSGLPGPAPSNQSNTHISAEFACRGRDHNPRPESIFNKPRSVSSSRAGELRSYNFPMYSEVSKPKSKPIPTEDLDNVVSGSLLIKPSKDNQNNFVEIRNNANKSNSMPNHYQRRDMGVPRGGVVKADSPTPNKYEEYVAEKRVRNILDQPGKMAPDPPQRKVTINQLALPPEPDVIMRKKPTNLEDAINELEAIYKSLKLGDESLLDRAERRDIPTPTNFEKYAEVHAGEFLDDDDDESGKEPDVIRDDFAYRNIKHANLAAKASEKQPPFGIPIGPIAPSPRTDYLHVTPDKDSHKVRTAPFKYPDIVGDDLAVRTLRKDPPGQVKPQFLYPAGCLKKKRATRTQSANIYSLIQRNAAKPSGGDLHDYLELARTLERAGSMSDIRKETDDIPSTLQLLRNLREQEQGSPKSIPFRHPSQGGAICNLPVVLTENEDQQTAKIPIPLPRKSLSPDPEKTKMEEALNKIAKEAKESSEKLTKELMELRKEALITSSRPKVNKPSIERDLEQIEAVSEAAKRCRHILMDTIPPDTEDQHPNRTPPRRLATEDKLIKAIDQVSDAANKVCEKILNEIVTVEPPVIVQHAVEVKNRPKQELVMPSLIQKLDPSSARIGEIAERCMRQISELNDIPDYDNLHPIKATACNTIKHEPEREKRSDADLLIVPGSSHHHQQHTYSAVENEEEIDKIMKECEEQARNEANAVSKQSVKVDDTLPQADGSRDVFVSAGDKTTTTTSASSSSDCLKSSSPSAGQRLSSSITSFNPYSSSDYIKSPSSDFHAPSTDPIKTFSTTSYDVKSSSVTPNITNSPFSYTPSPPLNLTPVCSSGGEREKGGERSGSTSQYNSSEELAMIFGIEKSSPATTTTGKEAEEQIVVDCPVPSPVGVLRCSESNKPDVLPISNAISPAATTTTTTTTTTTSNATNPEFCESVIVCKLHTIDEDHEDPSACQVSRFYLPSYTSNVSIIVSSVIDDDDDRRDEDQKNSHTDFEASERQFDSLGTVDESSNPDSGNVSLSDFPVQSPVNTSLEVELTHNSRFEVANNFVNEITIDGAGSYEIDYLRSLFAHDEVSTSFSFDEPLYGDREIESEDPHSPGQLLHEVLSEVSRINAETNRKQLLSQLDNISECTRIVEDLSDRLSHSAIQSRLRSYDENVEDSKDRVENVDLDLDVDDSVDRDESSEHMGKFSEHCDCDYDDEDEDQDAYVRPLKLLGHHLSSSEESIPPIGEIFSVPLTDSDNETHDDSTSSSEEPNKEPNFCLSFDERQKMFEEECMTLKNALHKVLRSGLMETPVNRSNEDSLSLSPEVVSVIEVVDSGPKSPLDDHELQMLLSGEAGDESLTLSEVVSIAEEVNSSPEDLQLKELLSEPPRYSSEEVSIVEIVDLDAKDCPDSFRLKTVPPEGENVSDSYVRYDDLDSASSLINAEVESPNEFPSQISDVIPADSDNESSVGLKTDSYIEKVYLSPVSISLNIVNQVSRVSFVDSSEEDFGPSSQKSDEIYEQASEIIVVDSSNESYSNSEGDYVPRQALSTSLEMISINSESFSMTEYESKCIKRVSFGSDVLLKSEEPESQPNHEPHTSNLSISSQSCESHKVPSKHRPSSSDSSIQLTHLNCDQHRTPSNENVDRSSLLRYRPSSSPAGMSLSQTPTTQTTSKSLSLLAQPRNDDRLTTLEHILLACTLGVVTGNDLITMLAIIVGVLTLIAIVLL